jgi:signal transduction histidine kinase/ligand-binding sensor domain-containing protein
MDISSDSRRGQSLKRSKNAVYFWLLLLGCLLGQGMVFASEPVVAKFPFAKRYFENVGALDDVPGGVVTSLARSPDGLIWLGTQEGLVRYDGHRFLRFQSDARDLNSLPGNFIRALQFDQTGRLWIATMANGLAVFDPKSGRFSTRSTLTTAEPKGPGLRAQSQLLSDRLVGLATDARGMWVASDLGAQLLNGDYQVLETLLIPQGSRDDTDKLRSILRSRSGEIWLGSHAALWRQKPGAEALEKVDWDEQRSFRDQVINTLFEDQRGYLWVGTRLAGLARFRPDGSEFQRLRAQGSDANGLLGDRIQALAQASTSGTDRADQAEEIWVASTLGLHVLNAQTMRVLEKHTHAPSQAGTLAIDAIGALLADGAGSMWIGTWGGGLQKTASNQALIRSIRRAEKDQGGLQFPDAHALLELQNGQLLIGTGGSGLELFDPIKGRIEQFAPSEAPGGLPDGVVIALAQDANQRVWLGTQRSGLYLFQLNTRTFQRIGPTQTVSNLLFDSKQSLWLGTSNGVSRLDLASLAIEVVKDVENKAVIGQINPLAIDRDGRIWAGSADGLRVLLPNENLFRVIRHVPGRDDSLLNNAVYGLLVDPNNKLWVATESGLDELISTDINTPKFKHWGEALNRSGSDFGANLMMDKHGRLWSDKLLIDIERARSYVLSKTDGLDLGTIWTGAYTQFKNGLMLHGGTQGVAIIDADNFAPDAKSSTPIVLELRVNGQHRTLGELQPRLELSPKERSFAIEFSTPDFAAPKQVSYRYRLLGFEREWINTSALARVASYSNLWPGDYMLEIESFNRFGVPSEAALRLPVRVIPAFWQSLWFAMLALAFLASLIWLVLMRRTRRLARLATDLEQQVSARTLDLQASNAELKSSHAALQTAQQHLIEAQQKLVMQEKMAALGQLVSGLAHEVNTPIGIAITASSHLEQAAGALGKSLDSQLLRKSELEQFVADAQTASQLVASNLNRAAKLVGQFKQIAVGERNSELERIDLSEFLPATVKLLEPLWRDHNIRFVLNPVPELSLSINSQALVQILSNLVQNAVLHAFAERSERTITLQAQIEAKQWSLMLADNGSGMDPQTLARVFDPFFTTKRNQGGTGLGLHIAFNLATAMGGQLTAHSELGCGSQFKLVLPL